MRGLCAISTTSVVATSLGPVYLIPKSQQLNIGTCRQSSLGIAASAPAGVCLHLNISTITSSNNLSVFQTVLEVWFTVVGRRTGTELLARSSEGSLPGELRHTGRLWDPHDEIHRTLVSQNICNSGPEFTIGKV